jgi:hypothetical protein
MSEYGKSGDVHCIFNFSKHTYGHCSKLSDPDCGVGCGCNSDDDAKKRCSHFIME